MSNLNMRPRLFLLGTMTLLIYLALFACAPVRPLPTYTPYPTLTPDPTVTAYPTYTPVPTTTPRPTYTRYPTSTPSPEPTQSFGERWGVAPGGNMLDTPFVLVACYTGTSDFDDSNEPYWVFTDDGDWYDKTVYASVMGVRTDAFRIRQCYRMAVSPMFGRGEETTFGYECGDSTANCELLNGTWWDDYWHATELVYELVDADAYERLTTSEYRQYGR